METVAAIIPIERKQSRFECVMRKSNDSQKKAVCYLARGARSDWRLDVSRFIDSYQRFYAGEEHRLYVILKGFSSAVEKAAAVALFEGLEVDYLPQDDASLDLGAYCLAADAITEEATCFLNTSSEILGERWLSKLSGNLMAADVGLVGATGSFEAFPGPRHLYGRFPNPHLRTNAFMLITDMLRGRVSLTYGMSKNDAYEFESGKHGLTNTILASGKEVLVVGRNGRGYGPNWWATSDTFRQGRQMNLLVADNQTRAFMAAPWNEKIRLSYAAWGRSNF